MNYGLDLLLTILIILWYFWYTMSKVIVSNVRLPEDEWLQLKAAAASMGKSVNEYIRYLSRTETIKNITGIKKIDSKARGYEALEKFINRKIKGKPMGASEEDKIIYDV